jgi:hypothetical protein
MSKENSLWGAPRIHAQGSIELGLCTCPDRVLDAALKAVPKPTPTPAQRRRSFRLIQGDRVNKTGSSQLRHLLNLLFRHMFFDEIEWSFSPPPIAGQASGDETPPANPPPRRAQTNGAQRPQRLRGCLPQLLGRRVAARQFRDGDIVRRASTYRRPLRAIEPLTRHVSVRLHWNSLRIRPQAAALSRAQSLTLVVHGAELLEAHGPKSTICAG